jgi:two-component system response regulator (stage 0 sporulation protein F)
MSKKVLVVDDEIGVCKQLRKFVEAMGCRVMEAYSGTEALTAYMREGPDLVLLDVRMPGMDGLETLKELKTFDPDASVIMVTAVHEEELARQAMNDGAFEYITKPINPEYLEIAVMTKLALTDRCE